MTVRGQFHELTDRARAYLVGAQAQHDIFESKYTDEGTFTYDAKIDFFNFRYEVRQPADASADDAAAHALLETEQFLNTMGFGHHRLRTDVVDMSAMWDQVARRRPS